MSVLAGLRQRLMSINGRDDRAQLDLLRRALASTESPAMIHAIAVVASELGESCLDDLLGEVAALKDHVALKAEALGVSLVSVRRMREHPDGIVSASPSIEMRVSAWEADEFGNQCRTVSNASDPPP
jgi:hypothetical protein